MPYRCPRYYLTPLVRLVLADLRLEFCQPRGKHPATESTQNQRQGFAVTTGQWQSENVDTEGIEQGRKQTTQQTDWGLRRCNSAFEITRWASTWPAKRLKQESARSLTSVQLVFISSAFTGKWLCSVNLVSTCLFQLCHESTQLLVYKL